MTSHAHPILAAALDRGHVLNRVLVTRYSLDAASRLVPDLNALLTDDEIERVARLLTPRLQSRAAAARAILRAKIADRMGGDPKGVMFELGSHGKPKLVGEERYHFSVSHSAERLVIATSQIAEIGVDVELMTLDRDVDAAAKFALNADDRAALDALPGDRRKLGFLRLWTAKEAFLKAIGIGLHRSMRLVVIDPAGLATLGESAVWRPQGATLDGVRLDLADASIGDDVICLAFSGNPAWRTVNAG